MKSFILLLALVFTVVSAGPTFAADYSVKPRAARTISAPISTPAFDAGLFGGGGTCVICNSSGERRHCSVGGFAGSVACAPLCLAMGCASCSMRRGNC
jgi:hypothetical protein